MPPRSRRIRTDHESRFRTMHELEGKPGMGGLVRVGNRRGGLGGQESALKSKGTEGSTVVGEGQLLILSATGVAIDPGGDYVTFDGEVHRRGYADGTDGTSVVWPVSAVGYVQVEMAWATYTGGGKVEIEVDGVVPSWGVLADAAAGQSGSKRRGVDIPAGSRVKVKITQTSGAAQTADVLVEFGVQDPIRELLNDYVLDYGSPGWSYQMGAPGIAAGFEDPSYDVSAWSVGTMAFGTTSAGGVSGSLGTTWPSSNNDDLCVRRELPAGLAGVSIDVYVDDNVTAWVNGVQVFDNTGVEGNALTDPLPAIVVSDALLNVGAPNVFAFRARDRRAVHAWLDVRITGRRRVT